ncbi:733_t:CDS:2 [Entrophospora sp. SA101]|nr:733_t:CDS:2 [Entrophospora sp. SA101]CAJ0918780.1 966_t:CDS:2 [Entrophospora sp. SA101]
MSNGGEIKPTVRYMPIENYGMVGNLRTIALCSTDGSIDFFCYPKFDSPSIFARILDSKKGGHFSIAQSKYSSVKQQYLPNSNILSTRFLDEEGVSEIIDYMHIPEKSHGNSTHKPLLPWLVRSLTAVRAEVDFHVELFPAFNYALDPHTIEILDNKINSYTVSDTVTTITDENNSYVGDKKVRFNSENFCLELRYVVGNKGCVNNELPTINFELVDNKYDDNDNGVSGGSSGVVMDFCLKEDQEVIFILREVPNFSKSQDQEAEQKLKFKLIDPPLSYELMKSLYKITLSYWQNWIGQSTYKGRWREHVHRSALALKLLTYEPTGAVVASPTFGLPEAIGGPRNWDYRYTWIRDSAFTFYALMRLGMTEEAKSYMKFMEERCHNLDDNKSLNIMYSIDGEEKLTEIELNHLDGYRSSKPVRIGNGAYDHLQLDIYGEFMDAMYLYNKYGSPIGYDMWVTVRRLVNFVCSNWDQEDMSIWEVRGQKQNFTYSKIMCWVAVDRGLRLAEKRMFPCPDRNKWLDVRDKIYEEVMTKAWNPERKIFTQSYESKDDLDSSVLIMPLVFFISPNDPRFLSTVEQILLPPQHGGLLANNLVYRYNHEKTDDGLEGKEGSFSMCTFWLVEALTRGGKYEKKLLEKAELLFEQMISYSNHLGLYSEEIAVSGESLGNFPQAFTHIAFISAAFNLDRVLNEKRK